MGLSMGGMIVQTMAIEHPERLLSMTSMMSTTGDTDVGQSSPEAQQLFMAAPPTDRESYIERHLAGICARGAARRTTTRNACARTPAAAFDRCFAPDGQARQVDGDRVGRRAAPPRCARCALPALVLHGSEDKLIDPSGGRRTAEAIPGARFVLLDGMGHDYPPAYWDQIVHLVTEHARGGVLTPSEVIGAVAAAG